jgi:spermidine dehydrogenase
MSNKDDELGMHAPITRRDFVNGVGIALTGAMFAGSAAAGSGASVGAGPKADATPPNAAAPLDPYPPRRTGLRGSHPGSFEVAHQMRDARAWDLTAAIDSNESYDLIIVGGGISGLSAAHFFLKSMGGNARVLVLDNHDDFGGHAKRNEFEYQGRLMALNGGTLNVESPCVTTRRRRSSSATSGSICLAMKPPTPGTTPCTTRWACAKPISSIARPGATIACWSARRRTGVASQRNS